LEIKKVERKVKVRGVWKTNKAYLFIIPGLLVFFVLNLYPIIFSIYLGFTDAYFGNITGKYQFIGLKNFEKLLISVDTRFYYVLGRTFLFVATSVPLKVLFGLALAIIFNLQMIKGRSVLRSLLILPWTLPAVLSILTWRGLLYYDFGAINGILQAIGLPRVNWLNDTTNAFVAYNIVEVWLAYPFMMTVILAALQSVPLELYDSAKVDGASAWQRLRYITLPLIWRPLLFGIVLTSGASFQAFMVPYLLNSGGPANQNELIMVWGYKQAFQNPGVYGSMGLAAAFFVLVSLIILAFSYAGLKLGKITVE
jgi:arabinogalactan oligomer/maltooligosaccharide transport system permease protein